MERMGIRTRAEWDSLPDEDRFEWLAYDYRRRDGVERIMDSFNERIANEKPIEFTAFIMTLMELLK